MEIEFYRNDEQWLHVDISNRSAHRDFWREISKLEARDTNKADMCET